MTLDVMLQGSAKPTELADRGAEVGVSFSADLSKLSVCFGGFSPMALSDGNATQEQVAEAEARASARRAQLERAAAIEAARASDPLEWTDAQGSTWRYVVLDGRDVRIEGCASHAAQLVVPSVIGGRPVVALAADACSHLADVTEIICSDSILSIGYSAFRFNKGLRRIQLPALLSQFDSNWLYGCVNLEHLVLPGELPKIDASLFDLPKLRTLVAGAGLGEIAPGTFAKSKLERIEVSAANPFLKTDGRAFYTKDGGILVALAVPCESYQVLDGCGALAKKALSNFSCVRQVELPESIEVIGEFAFSRTSVTSFDAPRKLRHLMEKAFFNCAQLERVSLREGLLSVGSNAFTGTGIRELRLPASVCELGHPLADRTNVTYAGAHATFSIAEGCKRFELDEAGVLYAFDERGRHLLRMIDPRVETYAVREGTRFIDDGACADHARLSEVYLPEGVCEIGHAAFRGCRSLRRVDIPASVRRVEEDAFLDTALESVRLPASLDYVGRRALVTYGAHHGDEAPSLRKVMVEEGNERFFTTPGLLLERKEGGRARVLLCTGDVEVVRIPEEVDEIAPYAFNGVRNLKELYLSDRIGSVGIRGLAVDGLLDRITISLEQPIEGHESFDLFFPHTDRGAQQQMLALSVSNRVNVEMLFEHYDNAIVNASSFDMKSRAGLSLYDQVVRIVERLRDPVFMSPVNRSMSDRVLSSNIEKICVSVAKRDDRKTIEALVDFGYINDGNLLSIIDQVGELKDAGVTGYLLEMKRLRFGRSHTDFDL